MRIRQSRTDGRGRRRLGLSTAETVVLVGAVATLGALGLMVTPYVLEAGAPTDSSSEIDRAAWPDHLVDAVAALEVIMANARATLAIEPPVGERVDGGAVEFIALEVPNDADADRLNRSEVVILRFSRMLRSISVYVWKPSTLDGHDPEIAEAELADAGFIDRLLRLSGTEQRVIGLKIDGVRVVDRESSDESAQPSRTRSPGRIQLTSPTGSDDSRMVASIPTALPPWRRLR